VQRRAIRVVLRRVEFARGLRKSGMATGKSSRWRFQNHAAMAGKAPDILSAEKETLSVHDFLRQRMGNLRSGLCESHRARHSARPGDVCE